MTKVKRICKYCGKEFEKYPSDIKQGRGKFCSQICQGKWRSENLINKDNPTWKGGKVKQICPQCGKGFFIFPSRIKSNITNYCSRLCVIKSRMGKGKKIKRMCQICGKEFEVFPSIIKKGGGKYCSNSCTRKARKFPTHHTKPELIFEAICKKHNLPFKYTGDGSFWIKNINPDFVECNGKKTAVEIFGDYWHSPLLNRNLREKATLSYRKRILKKYGWKLIVFWETDLKRPDAEHFILSQIKEI